MVRPARFTPLTLVVTAALTTVMSGLSQAATYAGTGSATTVSLHGTLLVVDSGLPGGPRSYAVALADGDIVPVSGHFGPHALTGAAFDGRVSLPAGETAAGLHSVAARGRTLALSGSPSVTAPAPATTPTTHDQFVAALDNEGALGQDDSQLLGHVSTVGAYWTAESNGAIAGVTVPSTVTHYDTTLSTTDCGLGSDFFSVVQEAEDEFPDFSFGGGDQLVVFVPPACASGSYVGEGTIGSSFASGGALVVKAGDAIQGTYAHETGHNYGFEHANARESGTSMEYYGVYDVMGYALNNVNQLTALSTPFRVFQGITDPGEILDVDLGNLRKPVHTSTTILPRSGDSGQRSVEVTDPDTGENLYLDYRSGTGQDTGAFYAKPHNGGLGSSQGTVNYAPGVLITAARDDAGTDVLVVDDQGDTSLGAEQSWTNASGDLTVTVSSVTAGGAGVDVDYDPALGALTTAKPVIHGKAKVGRTLVAKHGHWSAGTTFTYAWYAGSTLLKHQTGSRLLLTKARRGDRIKVKVTGTNTGYATVTRTSAKTHRVS